DPHGGARVADLDAVERGLPAADRDTGHLRALEGRVGDAEPGCALLDPHAPAPVGGADAVQGDPAAAHVGEHADPLAGRREVGDDDVAAAAELEAAVLVGGGADRGDLCPGLPLQGEAVATVARRGDAGDRTVRRLAGDEHAVAAVAFGADPGELRCPVAGQ